MSPRWYLVAYIVPFFAILSLLVGGWFVFFIPLFLFGFCPLAELLTRGSDANPSPSEEAEIKQNRLYDYLLYGMVPAQYALFATLIWQACSGAYTYAELFGATVSIGICGGSVGINVAHELGHRKKRYEQVLAKAMLLTVLYMHFFIEHNRGHHARVATDEDPASARKGEIVYFFIVRSVVMGIVSAWHLEADRLRRLGKSTLSLSNEMLRMVLIEVGTVGAVAFFAGPLATACAVTAAGVSIVILEAVNYIEHYGLRRERNDRGRWEAVQPAHSWNSNHTLGRILLFELTRHSDHHAYPTRKYPLLRHHEEAPQLPTGYPGMILLSLLPPLYFYVMHKRLAQWQGMDAAKAI